MKKKRLLYEVKKKKNASIGKRSDVITWQKFTHKKSFTNSYGITYNLNENLTLRH